MEEADGRKVDEDDYDGEVVEAAPAEEVMILLEAECWKICNAGR